MTDPDVSRRRERWRRQAQYLRDNGRLTSVPFRAAHHESAHAVASIYGLRETRAERGAELKSPLVKCVWINRIAVVASRPEDGPCWTGGAGGRGYTCANRRGALLRVSRDRRRRRIRA
jgi:hypothetical protein